MNASVLVVILLLELLFITISHAFIIIVPTTTHLRPVVVIRSINEVGILSNEFGTTTSSTSALEASSTSEVEVDDDASSSSDSNLTLKEKNACTMLKEVSTSNLLFRIVVVGNGAILESTNLLGSSSSSSMKLNQSPVSGANIVTFASSDQSFEFHLMIGQIDKVAFIEKDSPINKGKTMRIIRFINDESGTSKSICSLILATAAVAATSAADGVDDNDDTIANDWFKIMISKYGSEHTFLN